MKLLVQPYTHTLSHLSRPLAVALEMRNRGHEVIFAGESTKICFIEREGFTIVPSHEPNPEILYGNIRKGNLRFVDDEEIQLMLKADLDLYYSIKPDLVLTDGRFTAPISTHIAGIKHAAIVNVSSTEYRALPYIPFFDWMPDTLAPAGSPIRNGLNSLNLYLEMFVFDHVMATFSALSRKHGLKKMITATNCLTGKDITLLPDIPEYFPTKNLPDDYHYIGPLTFQQKIPPPDWWPPKTGGRPLVYFTMGTTGVSNFFSSIYNLFRSSDICAIITTGGQKGDLVSEEGFIYVEEYLDGDLVMNASDLVICHGGNGTIYQALRHGKPIIGIPTIPDQEFNMRRVESLGIGKIVSWQEFLKRPEVLLETAYKVQRSNSFYENSLVIRNIIKCYNPEQKAAQLLEHIFQ